ncbi:MipA/OmpV family protein [Nitrospirillum amazonense]|uniref:MipA/OmpV family protein n=1 Tax=Nitrospirillum amazonense TaxID=28077 RepID=UPI002412A4F4|nr:MipA/OmpV family protein [Nitrospirillum amazonense]MDG3439778.1 MipA/OmpV family protein [Nitrospirillum amazonense]
MDVSGPPSPRRTIRRPALISLMLGLALCLFCLMPGKAQAQTPSPLSEWQYSAGVLLRSKFENPLPTWDVSVGAATSLQPRYVGSSEYHVQPGINLDVRYKDIAFFSMGEGLGVNLLRGENFRAGVALGFDVGRDQDDSSQLHGLGDISPAPEAKVFAEYTIFPVVLRTAVRRGFGGNNGWVGDVSAYLPVAGSERFFVFVGPTATYANSSYMRRYFGINPNQSIRSGYRQFTPGSGFSSAGFGSSAVWFWTEHWFMTADGAYQRLLGDAADSPITRAHSQLTLNLSVAYRF